MNSYEKTGGGGGVPPSPIAPEIARSFSLFRSLADERNASPIVSTVCSLFAQNNRGIPQLFFIPRSPSEGPQREPPLAPTLHTHKFAVSLEPESVQLPVPHSGLSLKTENLQLITPSKQPRLLRPLARNLFQSRIMFPQRLRHFHLFALQRRDQFQRVHHRFPFIMIVRNHINFPRRFFQLLHALGPRLQLFRRVQIVVSFVRRNRFIITKPSIVPPSVQPHINHRRSRLLRRAHRTPDQRLIDVAESRVVFRQQFKRLRHIPRRVSHFHHQRKIRESFKQLHQINHRVARPMKRERELQQHRAQFPSFAQRLESRAHQFFVLRGSSLIVRKSLHHFRRDQKILV